MLVTSWSCEDEEQVTSNQTLTSQNYTNIVCCPPSDFEFNPLMFMHTGFMERDIVCNNFINSTNIYRNLNI